MNEESTNPGLASNLKTLTKSISSAQSSIFRCKSTLKCIEEELIYLNLSCNTNTNNRESKRVQQLHNSPNPEVIPYNVDTENNPTKILDTCSHNFRIETFGKPSKTKRSTTNVMTIETPNNNIVFPQDSNVCNISGELTNLLKAQQKLLCQIDRLKCEIGEKSGSIDTCLKENQFFNCKFKEIENHIDQLRRDVEKIKKDLAMTVTKDRCFSPYSHESLDRGGLLAPQATFRHHDYRGGPQERNVGYQDVYTPENSIGMAPMPRRSVPNLSMNFRDGNCQSKTFDDLIRKSRLEMDCNINNCRNNQNTSSLNPLSSTHSHVLMDFVSLNNQIKNLRKMAECIFKNNCNITIRRPLPVSDEQATTVSRSNDIVHDDQSKLSINRPMAETTLSLINPAPSPRETKPQMKEDSSSVRSSASDSDTSCCFYTEDQFPGNSPSRTNSNTVSRPKKIPHTPLGCHGKKGTLTTVQTTYRNSQNKSYNKHKERMGCRRDGTTSNNCSTSRAASGYHNHPRQCRQVCPECKNVITSSRHQADR